MVLFFGVRVAGNACTWPQTWQPASTVSGALSGMCTGTTPEDSAKRHSTCGDSRPSMVRRMVSTPKAPSPIPGDTAAIPASFTTATSTPSRNTGTMHHGRSTPNRRIAPRKAAGSRPCDKGPNTQSNTVSCNSGNTKPASPVMTATTQWPWRQVMEIASSSDACCTMP